MRVELAKPSGACYGVDRALKMAFDAVDRAGEGGVSTLGPLIHNPTVVAELEERGARVAESVDDVAGGTLVIRSHGVPVGVAERACARGLEVVDATCPHVSRVQSEARRLAEAGRLVVILGEPGHPEVEAIRSYAGPFAAVIEGVEDIDRLPESPQVGLVVQTTQPKARFEGVARALAQRFGNLEACNTICSSTELRQSAAVELAARVDAMVVIGGRNSGNTRRLHELCAEVCPRTFHIESAGELEPRWFEGCVSVGVTAGASTPQSQIATVVDELERL